MKVRHVLLAMLGGQPQVVTLALDLLLQRGEAIDDVVAVHLGTGRYVEGVRRLAAEFPGDRYQGRQIHFRNVQVMDHERPLADIRQSLDAEAVWQTLHELLGGLKAGDAQIHLLLAGGRRLMSLLALSVAMLHFDHGDRAWHLYTPDVIREQAREGREMHVAPEVGVQLIAVPLAPWGSYFPGLRALLHASPAQVLAAQGRWLDRREEALCRQVWAELTPQQRVVAKAFAEGARREQVAEQLFLAVSTVDTHKSQILAKCKEVWELETTVRLDYHFLREKFGSLVEAGVLST